MRMTTEEAFVKVLQRHGIEHAFGIIGSAFMPISDLFPRAGITFWDCAHEGSGGMMADGYTRASGKMSMMIAQNGPGITNFVTAVKTAYWNHTPLLLVTPQAANKTIGMGGFQEVEQMALFKDMVAYQEEVRDPARVAEVLNRVILNAKRMSAPAQINMPWDGGHTGGGGPAVIREIPGDPERGGGGFGGGDPGEHGLGRAVGCPGLRGVST
jgi:sulfoacetaldehyde acetyltransferase